MQALQNRTKQLIYHVKQLITLMKKMDRENLSLSAKKDDIKCIQVEITFHRLKIEIVMSDIERQGLLTLPF